MTLEPNSTHYGDDLEPDLTILPGWKGADATTRVKIVDAAKRYVLEQDPETHKWLGTNILYRPAYAGYRALYLLLREDTTFVSVIPADIWKKWASLILDYQIPNVRGEELHRKLVKMAYDNAPDEIIESLKVLIDKENREFNSIFITQKLEDCWDARLENALLIKTKERQLKSECMGCLLSDLLDHGVGDARVLAESLIPLPPPTNGEPRSRAIIAARVLMTHAKDEGWSVVWPAIVQDYQFGREVMSALTDYWEMDGTFSQRLTIACPEIPQAFD